MIWFYFKPPLLCFHVIFTGFRLLIYITGKLNDKEISLNFYIYILFYDSHYFIYDLHCIVSSFIYLVT